VSATAEARHRPEARGGGLVGAGLGSALLFASALLLPALGPRFVALVVIAMAAPLPLALQRLRGGLGGALLATALAAGLLGAILSPGLALAYLLLAAAPGLLMAESLARGRGLLRGCGWAFGLLAGEAALGLFFAGAEIPRLLDVYEQQRAGEIQALRARGLPGAAVDELEARLDTAQRVARVVYPALAIISCALMVLANAVLLRAYLARRDPGWLDDGEFESVRWPLALSVLFVLGGASVALPALRAVGFNVVLVVGFFYALQGLAIVAFYARRLAGPPLLRLMLAVLVLLNPWAPWILSLLGLFDTWADLRRWAAPPSQERH
jgi:uncharacterized protein YybS (DUF2232 family)